MRTGRRLGPPAGSGLRRRACCPPPIAPHSPPSPPCGGGPGVPLFSPPLSDVLSPRSASQLPDISREDPQLGPAGSRGKDGEKPGRRLGTEGGGVPGHGGHRAPEAAPGGWGGLRGASRSPRCHRRGLRRKSLLEERLWVLSAGCPVLRGQHHAARVCTGPNKPLPEGKKAENGFKLCGFLLGGLFSVKSRWLLLPSELPVARLRP